MILLYFISPIIISIEFCQKKIYKETEEGENSRSFNALFEEDKAKSLREQTRWLLAYSITFTMLPRKINKESKSLNITESKRMKRPLGKPHSWR